MEIPRRKREREMDRKYIVTTVMGENSLKLGREVDIQTHEA